MSEGLVADSSVHARQLHGNRVIRMSERVAGLESNELFRHERRQGRRRQPRRRGRCGCSLPSPGAAAGAGDRDWRAYLSSPATGNQPAVNARDRIGQGPWFNAKGVRVAANLRDLHGDGNLLRATSALTERGDQVPSHRHDMLTGSTPAGALADDAADSTCRGWTSNDAGRAIVGHHDRAANEPAMAWNSAHQSSSCSARGLESTGGGGLFYCFAND